MGNRHYQGGDRDRRRGEPSLPASGARIVFSWAVTLAFLVSVGGGLGNPAGAFVIFVLLFPVIALLMLAVIAMGLWTLIAAVRGSGPGPGNFMFWMEVLPSAVGVLVGLGYWSSLSAPW